MVWSWFVYVLAANLLLVIPLLWIAARGGAYALSRALARKSRAESSPRNAQSETTRELTSLVPAAINCSKREGVNVITNTARPDRPDAQFKAARGFAEYVTLFTQRKMSVSKAEPVMLEQISRISQQQIGYYLHRASMRGWRVVKPPRTASRRAVVKIT